MLDKKWLASALLGVFLTVSTGAGIGQAYAGTPTTAPIQTAEAQTAELAKHRGDHQRSHKAVKHREPAPRHDRHRPPRDDRRSHDGGNAIVGGIIGGIIGGILVNSSK